MKKILLVGVLAVALMLTFAACGSSETTEEEIVDSAVSEYVDAVSEIMESAENLTSSEIIAEFEEAAASISVDEQAALDAAGIATSDASSDAA